MATNAGESFLITEEGDTLEFDRERDRGVEENADTPILEEIIGKSREDFFQDEYGVDEEHYNWLLR